MLLADFFIWLGFLVVIGALGLVFVTLALVFRAIGAVFRGIVRAGRRIPSREDRSAPGARVCPNAYCGYLNAGAARYCARCGQPMHAVPQVKNYG